MSTRTFDQIKKEMQARLTELQPFVEEALQIEAILEADKSVRRTAVPAAEARPRRRRGGRGRPSKFNSFEHRVNSYYKRMREDLPEYFTLAQFSRGASFDQRNQEAMDAVNYLVKHGYVDRLDPEAIDLEHRPHGWWMANCLYTVVDPQRKTNFKKGETAIA